MCQGGGGQEWAKNDGVNLGNTVTYSCGAGEGGSGGGGGAPGKYFRLISNQLLMMILACLIECDYFKMIILI